MKIEKRKDNEALRLTLTNGAEVSILAEGVNGIKVSVIGTVKVVPHITNVVKLLFTPDDRKKVVANLDRCPKCLTEFTNAKLLSIDNSTSVITMACGLCGKHYKISV